MFRKSILLAAALAVSAGAALAAAPSRVEVGVLTCGGDTWSIVVASRTDLNCTFRRSDGALFRYRGTIRRVGLDLGINQRNALQWAVLAPTYQIPRKDLRGNYGGVAAGASLGYGLGANVLIGGSGDTIALQPVSVEAQSGVSVNAGIAGLELR